MSWANIRELIFHERKVLDPVICPVFPQQTRFGTRYSALLAPYLDTKAAVDASIRHFTQTLEWPRMSATEKFFLAARLDFGWEVSSVLNTYHEQDMIIPFPSPQSCRTAHILEWLLIDIWPYGCAHFFQKHRWLPDQPVRPHQTAPVSESTCVV